MLKFVRGPSPLEDDPKFLTLRSSSLPRALLENLTTKPRVVPIEQLEARLEQILHVGGEREINDIRDHAREIAEQFGWHAELERLDTLFGTLLGTRRGRVASAVARARAIGEPFDASCLERLHLLFAELRKPMPAIADTFTAADHFKNKAFFEAYFSNYIESGRPRGDHATELVPRTGRSEDRRLTTTRTKATECMRITGGLLATRATASSTWIPLVTLVVLDVTRARLRDAAIYKDTLDRTSSEPAFAVSHRSGR